MLLAASECLKLFGPPETEKHLILWDIPTELEIGVIPKRLYCHRAMPEYLTKAFKSLIETGLIKELKTWDGCFNIRRKRSGLSQSLHSWGLAIDINAAWNGYNRPTQLTEEFVKCFTDNGFDWGGYWKIKDGMHFQLKREIFFPLDN
jgi:hypothetical protein